MNWHRAAIDLLQMRTKFESTDEENLHGKHCFLLFFLDRSTIEFESTVFARLRQPTFQHFYGKASTRFWQILRDNHLTKLDGHFARLLNNDVRRAPITHCDLTDVFARFFCLFIHPNLSVTFDGIHRMFLLSTSKQIFGDQNFFSLSFIWKNPFLKFLADLIHLL